MSENATAVMRRLREQISKPEINLLALARGSKVSYDKLRRLKLDDSPLSVADAETLNIFLTGKTFIATPDAPQHS